MPPFLVSGKLEKLEILDCSNNAISSIPDGIRGCAALERLYLNVCCHGNDRLG
jgi:Leucine-rich repeat (LRR) protein